MRQEPSLWSNSNGLFCRLPQVGGSPLARSARLDWLLALPRRNGCYLGLYMALAQTASWLWDDMDSCRSKSSLRGDTLTRRSRSCAFAGISCFKLSYRDLVAMMGERRIDLAHTTILRWVQQYSPEFQKRWNRFARTVVARGGWMYLYRAVDKAGKTVDFHPQSEARCECRQGLLA